MTRDLRETTRGMAIDQQSGNASSRDLNETILTILGHRCCRAYVDRPVPDAMLTDLIAAAQSAPTSCDLQCWSVVAVSDPVDKAELIRLGGDQQHLPTAPLVLCFLADLERIAAVAAQKGLDPEALGYPEALLIGVIDAALAAQSFVRAAVGLGLGTCYISGLRNDVAAVSDRLGLPERLVAVFGLALGYPDPVVQPAAGKPTKAEPRLAPRALLHRGRYQAPDPTTATEECESGPQEFGKGQGRGTAPWGEASAARIAMMDRMEGRDALWDRLRARELARK